MKTLLLFRHAKSDWSEPGVVDFDRPLAPRGEQAAPLVATYLRNKKLLPDLVLCSTAARAKQTWQLAAAELEVEPEVRDLKSLYLAAPSAILATIRRAPETAGSVMVIGHNPGMESLAGRLVGSGKPKAVAKMRSKFPTAAVAVIDFDATRWQDVGEGRGILRHFVRPKDLA